MPSRPVRRSVWIVEDSPTDAAHARAALERSWDVRVFNDGSAVLEALDEGPSPDVLVLDWVMPGITGIDVCRFLRGERRHDRLGILLLTARGSTEQVVEGLESGANDYISKPFADAELHARVANLVRMRELLERAEVAEGRTRDLLESSPDALLEVDEKGVIRYANAEAVDVFGAPAEELVGVPLADLAPELGVVPEQPPAAGAKIPLQDVQRGERILSPSVRLLGGGGSHRRTIALRDVTEQRRAERRRLDFYSIVAHDLRSPLMAIQLRTEAIQRGRRGILPAELLADLRKIQGNIRSLVAMINDFLDLARLESAAYHLERAPLDLDDLVSTTVDDFRPLAEASQLSLETRLVGGLHIEGDRSRLKQVVSNLVSNALKFTPAGGAVSVLVERRGDRAYCAVEDTGRGIAEEARTQIFERYARALDPSHEVAGTGLGLMIVKEIITAHHGAVGVESELGKGSTFWFELPIQG